MPYRIVRRGKKGYGVESIDTGKIHAKKHQTLAKAKAQMRTLYSKMGREAK